MQANRKIGKTITGAVHIRHNFSAEKRHALEAWARQLETIISGSETGINLLTIGRST